MLDIPELEAFDKTIWANSWLDESTGELMAWSRGGYDDFRRKHPEYKLPTSTDALSYFGVSLDRFGWMEVMSRRYGLFVPDRQGNELEWGRHKNNNSFGEFNSDDEVVYEPFPDNIQDMSIVGWEDKVIKEVDDERFLSLLFHRNRKCPGGADCCLDDDVEHELCICKDENCKCHSRERYQTRTSHNPYKGVSMYSPPRYYRALSV